MDSIFGWIIVTGGAWYGSYRFFLAIIKADEERKARNNIDWDEMR